MNSTEEDSAAEEEERRAIIEQRARPWMIAAYLLTAVGIAVLFFGPHVALDQYSPLRLGAVVFSLAGTACLLVLVSLRYPESTQGEAFRVGIAFACSIAVTGAILEFAGLFDADFNVVGTQTVAKWLTQWEGGWGQSQIAGGLSSLPAIALLILFAYLFNVDPSFQRWLHPVPTPKRRRPADRSGSEASPSGGEDRMKTFARAVIIFGLLVALIVGFIGFLSIIDNMRNFAAGVIAMAISAAVIVMAGGLLLCNSK